MSEANFFKEKSPEEILKANEKRLRSWVKPYKQPDSSLGAEDDLMQIARVAFLDAIKTFDPKKTKSKNFDTWAWFCVRKAVVGELREKGGGLSGGSSEQRGDPVIKKAQNFGIDVSNTDKAVPSSPDDSRIQALAKHFKLSPQSVASRLLLAQTKEMAKQEVRLDKIPASEVFISSGNKTTGRIEGQENNILYSIGFEKPIDDKMADEQLLEIINGLLPKIESLGVNMAGSIDWRKGVKVTRLYFGLDGGEQKNMKEIGKIVGISDSRVSHILKEMLKKLKQVILSLHPDLRDFIRGDGKIEGCRAQKLRKKREAID